jgi:hypothetical protein
LSWTDHLKEPIVGERANIKMDFEEGGFESMDLIQLAQA